VGYSSTSNIAQLLAPIGLAHWILSDGYWDNHYQVVSLCTDFFAEGDILLLCEALHTRFDFLAKPNNVPLQLAKNAGALDSALKRVTLLNLDP